MKRSVSESISFFFFTMLFVGGTIFGGGSCTGNVGGGAIFVLVSPEKKSFQEDALPVENRLASEDLLLFKFIGFVVALNDVLSPNGS